MRLLVGTLLLLAVQSTGRVEIVVRDATTRESIPGVLITMTSRSPNAPAGPPNTMVTDPRGLALFSALNAGAYTISIGEGYIAQLGSLPSYVLVEAGTSRRVDIPVKGMATLTGRIVDHNGAPSVAAVIALLSTVYVDGRQSLRGVGTATIDSEGNFRLTSVAFGEYYLRIENQVPWSVAYYPGVTDPSVAQKVTVRDQNLSLGDIRLPNPPRFKVSGSVTHSPSDASRGLTVYLSHDNPIVQEAPFLASASSTRVSSTEVRFELTDIPAGSYFLYLVLGDRALGSLGKENLRIDDRDIADLKIVLKPMVGIAGRIVMKDAQSKPPENLRIATPSRESFPLLLASDLSREAIAVARSGEFAVRNLVDGGRYGISLQGLPAEAYVSDIRLGSQSILTDGSFVASPTQDAFEIQIATPGGIIRGSVRDAVGQPAAAASIVAIPDFARRKNPAFYKRTTTDPRGQFVIRGLAPGDYQLFAWPAPPPQGAEEDPAFLGPFESRSITVRANAGITAEANLRLLQ